MSWGVAQNTALNSIVMTKRVYKFLSAQNGIGNLENRRLKLSTLDDLNDPFDLASIDTTDERINTALTALITDFRGRIVLLCFSRNWDNLLMWSHYGASHTGICAGFDISNDGEFDLDVHYQPNLLKIRCREDVNFDLANRLLRTKHESWSYEQEVRMFVGLNDPPDASGLRWIHFGPNLVLREVIVGAQCHPTSSKAVAEALKPYGDSAKCWWAGMRQDAFLLVKQDNPPHWHSWVE